MEPGVLYLSFLVGGYCLIACIGCWVKTPDLEPERFPWLCSTSSNPNFKNGEFVELDDNTRIK